MVEAEGEVDWRETRIVAEELCNETRDLRVAVELSRAALATEGLEAFAHVIEMMRQWQANFWEALHPELEDPNEGLPQTRVNCLATLTTYDQNPKKLQSSTLSLLKNASLVQGSRVGSVSLRDYQIAAGEIEARAGEDDGEEGGGQETATGLSTIAAIIIDAGPDASRSSLQAVDGALNNLAEISKDYDEHLGHGVGPNFSEITKVLKDIRKVIEKYGEVDTPADAEDEAGDGTQGADNAGRTGGVPGTINSREDAVLALDKICTYFERHEPSSPVPLILRRAKGLVSKSFIEVLQELTPDAVHTAEQIVGTQQPTE